MQRRYSKQREIILDAVLNSHEHPTAENVYNLVKGVLPNISLGTVYRNLKILSEDGTIKRIGSSYKNEHFDGRIDDHAHMLCTHCGNVVDIKCDCKNLINQKAVMDEDHLIQHIDVTFLGLCSNCKKETNNK